jgi:amidohydrolase
VVNHAGVVAVVEEAARLALGPAGVTTTHQSLGSEDFAWYLDAVPGALVRLGAALPDRVVDLHSSTFDVDERSIETGIHVGAAALLALLAEAG